MSPRTPSPTSATRTSCSRRSTIRRCILSPTATTTSSPTWSPGATGPRAFTPPRGRATCWPSCPIIHCVREAKMERAEAWRRYEETAAELRREKNMKADLEFVLYQAFLKMYHEDRANAAMHCAEVRYSPLTFRLAEAM